MFLTRKCLERRSSGVAWALEVAPALNKRHRRALIKSRKLSHRLRLYDVVPPGFNRKFFKQWQWYAMMYISLHRFARYQKSCTEIQTMLCYNMKY